MKKTVSRLLAVMLLVTMLVMTGCARKTTVVLTVDGYDADTVVPTSTLKIKINVSKVQDEKGIEPTKYTITGLNDGDYSLALLDMSGAYCPFTLKIHNGKVEAEAPEGVTVHPTIK